MMVWALVILLLYVLYWGHQFTSTRHLVIIPFHTLGRNILIGTLNPVVDITAVIIRFGI